MALRPKRDRGPQPIARSIDRLLGNLNAPPVDVLGVIFHDWESIVGPDIAVHTRPVAIEGDRLSVVADDSAWANEFKWLEPQVLKRLEEATESGRITRLMVRVQRRE